MSEEFGRIDVAPMAGVEHRMLIGQRYWPER